MNISALVAFVLGDAVHLSRVAHADLTLLQDLANVLDAHRYAMMRDEVLYVRFQRDYGDSFDWKLFLAPADGEPPPGFCDDDDADARLERFAEHLFDKRSHLGGYHKDMAR